MSNAKFSLYRYQLLPVNRYFQGDLYGPQSIEELIAQKNKLFASALRLPVVFRGGGAEVTAQIAHEAEDFFLFRLAVNRSVHLETRDFGSRSVSNWPKLWVAIWNHPDQQLIAVQHRPQAYKSPSTVVKRLIKSIEEAISRHQLVAVTEPLVEEKVFWNLLEAHKGKIRKIEFELVTPNMAAISKALPEDLKALARRSNAVKSKVVLESDPGASLVIEKGDEIIDGLASYTSKGGGSVSISLGGLKKKISTSKTIKEIEVQDAKLEGDSQEIAAILKSLMDNV